MKVMADTVSGVYEVEEITCEVSEEAVFYGMLGLMDDGEIGGAVLSPAMVEKIDSEYGITRLSTR